jgi:penicillin-binding protein 1A
VVIVKSIVDPFGEPLPMRRGRPEGRVITQAEAWLITSMLTDVISDPQGTAKAAKKLKRPAAGKTGTSNRARDAWFAGFTPQLAAVVWVGFDDYKSLGKKESGGRSAVPIWTQFMRDALQGEKKLDFGPPPEGIETALIDPASGLLAWEGQPDAIEEYFLSGTVPTEQAFSPDMITPEDFMMMEGLEDMVEEPIDPPATPGEEPAPATDASTAPAAPVDPPPVETPAPDPPASEPPAATSPSPPPDPAAAPAPASP